LDGYKRPLVGSLSANLQRFGMEKVARMESLQEIIEEMTEDPGTSEKTSPDCPMTSAKWQGMMWMTSRWHRHSRMDKSP
jgi:hypothetical protein